MKLGRRRAVMWVAVIAMPAQAEAQTTAIPVDFSRQVHAVFAAKCLTCHSQEKRSGGLSLATYTDVLNGGRSGAAVKPGKSAASILVQRIAGSDATRMPLGGPALSNVEIGILANWIDQGARPTPESAPAKGKWEAPLSLARPQVPDSPWKDWSAPLDRFTASYFARHHITKPSLVSDSTFARRAYLDIHGLLPPPEELRAFVADPAPGKRGQLVSRLLADNQKYAEHWISYWNDLLRNEEGVSYHSETAGRKSITDWLLASLLSNRPYNEWVAKLLNPTEPADPDGFLTGVNWRGTVSASQTPALQAAQNAAQVFLGINLKCNSCHDSFISRWKLKDAYSLAAFFSAEEKLKLYRCDVAQEEFAIAGFLFPELNRPLPSLAPADRRAVAAAIFTDPRNGRVPRTLVNRIWQKLMGRGIVEDVDEMDGEPWDPELLDWLSSEFVSSGYDLKALIRTIIQSRAYQLPAIARTGDVAKEYVFTGPEVRRLSAEQFSDAVAAITGDWRVANVRRGGGGRGGLGVISGAPSDGEANRPVVPVAAPKPQTTPSTAPAPVAVPIPPGEYVRGWRIPGSSIERALGRPIRDQVYSTRDTQSTTIQALELVNGEPLTHWLSRGARKMLGEPAPEPASLVARQVNAGRSAPVPFDVDISSSDQLYLIVQDSLSTAPDKSAPVWLQPVLIGPGGSTPLAALKPRDTSGLREDTAQGPVNNPEGHVPAVRVKLNSVIVYDIAGKGFTRFQGAPGHEPSSLSQGETVLARFFVFDKQPSLDRLVPPLPETPLPPGPMLKTAAETVDRVYWYALGRAPLPAERRVAEAALRGSSSNGKLSADGLADLLWALMMTPEFQLIR
jgi:mono/diheme cytochrome c family protein